MNRVIVLRKIAGQEFEDAIGWYDAERPGLGREFRAAINQQFDRIATNPEFFRKVRGEVRRAVIPRRFPYVIHFIIEPDQIVILSVFHASRDPKEWERRC